MSGLWFTRARLRRDAPDIKPLRSLFEPLAGQVANEGAAANAAHRLLWTLMPEAMQADGKPGREGGGQKAAFLWRQGQEANSYYLLGPEPRRDSAWFDVETKPYELGLAPGDRLAFDLVANATVDRMAEGRTGRDNRRRIDLVGDALKRSGAKTAADRGVAVRAVLEGWLAGQGERHGFSLESCTLLGHRTAALDGNRRKQTAKGNGVFYGVSHVTGILTVTDPSLFAAKAAAGFGRAKAFGCGLMLLRRAG